MRSGAQDAEDRGGSPLAAWTRALALTAPVARSEAPTFPLLIEELAEKHGEAPAVLSDATSLTYRALARRANQCARWAMTQGIGPGDVVCLMMANSPDYVAVWLGITRVGGIAALVNTNLTGTALAHAIRAVAPKHVIVGAELAGALPPMEGTLRYWAYGPGDHRLPRLDEASESQPGDPIAAAACPPPSLADRALYIYTSGTTGLPKAAIVSHRRLMQWSLWFAGMMGTRPSDRMYDCLPMYHSVGGIVAIGALLVSGGSVVIRERFSAARFWDDIARWDCTLFQYIGELCRYLVGAPPHPRETDHRLRLCCGNGLRRDIWTAFKERFRIPRILEFYAATEGNFSLYNCEGKPGAIGRIPSFLAHRFPVALVAFDAATGGPARAASGFCVRCATGETGEAIGRIGGGSAPGGRFEGYTDEAASGGKILRDVFEAGDAWYRTGDLMRQDESGYFYFVDRVGDTFRWKGENVSTTEVEETLAACPGIAAFVVYGVAVPGSEGRAGMAAIVPGPGFALDRFRREIAARLPEYARPLFVRLCGAIDTTATFKPRKQDLSREAYDPAVTSDPLYFDDRRSRAFVRLDAALYVRLQAGRMRL